MKLPRFDDTSCILLTACGEVKSGSKAFLDRLSKVIPMVARCRSGSRTVYLRVTSSGKSGKHLHIDCALREVFAKRGTPKVTHKRAQLMALVDKAIGANVDVRVVGRFVLPVTDLPEKGVVRSLYAEQETTGMTVKLTAGRFSITGAPVRNISWSVEPNGKDLTVQLEGRKSVEIEETYLQELLDWIDNQLRIFLLTRGEHARE